jgi:hypothetical protein
VHTEDMTLPEARDWEDELETELVWSYPISGSARQQQIAQDLEDVRGRIKELEGKTQ